MLVYIHIPKLCVVARLAVTPPLANRLFVVQGENDEEASQLGDRFVRDSGDGLGLRGRASVFAQTSNGTITGVVRDASGAVISGAKVVVTNESTASMRNATTSAVGTFRIESVEPGPYTVHVEKPGFKHST